MKFFMLILFVIFCSQAWAAGELRDILEDPAVSRRCKALLEDRSDKIKVQQRLNSLILRNQKLITRVKPTQKSVRNRLELNQVQLKNNLRLVQMRIKSMEENIVRKGCPGLIL